MKWYEKWYQKAKALTWRDVFYAPVKVLGWFMIWPAIPVRAELRHIVYNYVLGRNKTTWLKRLWERNPLWDGSEGWWLDPTAVGHDTDWAGYVPYQYIPHWKFWSVVWLWGFLDDDSNEDTTDWGHIERNHAACLAGVRRPFFGNAFDLGMYREEWPFFKPCATFWWTMRNSAMNFKYLWGDY